jgi:hypothetical protein
MSEKPLKSVDEHNTERIKQREELDRKLRLTGVACPNCKLELQWRIGYYDCNIWPTPTKRQAFCIQCNLMVQLEV